MRRVCIAGIIGTVLLSVISGGCGKQEEKESATGRYAELEIEVTQSGYSEAYLNSDGSYVLVGEGKKALIVDSEGKEKEVSGSWRKSAKINAEIERTLAPSGAMMLSYYPKYTEKQYSEMTEEELLVFSYLYVDELGECKKLEPFGDGYVENRNLSAFAFAPDEQLYVGDVYGTVFQMDTESGELHYLFQTAGEIEEFGFMGNSLIALDDQKAWLYDLEKGVLLESNEVLDEFVSSHQVKGKSIVLCTRAENPGEYTLYLGCRTGLYQYRWGGSVIEQIADDQWLSFGNSYYEPVALRALEDGTFLAFFSPSHLVKLYYDETLSDQPEKVLKIYSLEEDDRIRYAMQLFQKQNPDVLVQYETGIDGDNAVSTEDALKNLNTEILAGEGPDLLVLDGMDIEQYAKKGVLKELDEILQPYVEDGALYENIVDGMHMTENEKVYALPMTVQIPNWESDSKYLEEAENLEDVVSGSETAREDHPTGALLKIRDEEDLVKRLAITSLPAWTREDGRLDQEKLQEFLTAVKRLWDLNTQGMTEAEWEYIRDYFKEEDGWGQRQMQITSLVALDMGNNGIWMDFGLIPDVEVYEGICLDVENIQSYGLKDMEQASFGYWQGQANGVFQGQTIVGICEKAGEPELAQEFFELLLSDEMMQKWWLKKGLPVSPGAMEYCLDGNNNEYRAYAGVSNRDALLWPDEEEQQVLLDMMEMAKTFYQSGMTLEERVTEVGVQVCRGEVTVDQAVQDVARRIEIEMAE